MLLSPETVLCLLTVDTTTGTPPHNLTADAAAWNASVSFTLHYHGIPGDKIALTDRGANAVGSASLAAAAHLLQAGRIAKGAGAVVLGVLARIKRAGATIAPVAERPDVVVEEVGHRRGVAIVLPAGALAVTLTGDMLAWVCIEMLWPVVRPLGDI
jgi:hypothetical protein